ncbi:MAG: AI-2E family transporter [Lentisphaeria bacterium]|nr:AI-2E family transporter [Lentisphaeria bacterium]
MSEPEPKPEKPFSGVLRTGTGAGILAALAVIAVFILAATFLKSLFFGLIIACFLLPVEKFFEKKVFQLSAFRALFAFFDWLDRPFRRMKMRLAGGRIPSPEEIAERKRRHLIARSCLAAALSVILGIGAVLFGIGYWLIPEVAAAGQSIKDSVVVRNALSPLEEAAASETDKEAASGPQASPEDGEKDGSILSACREVILSLRRALPEYIRKNHGDAAKVVFGSGRNVIAALVTGLFSAISSLGVFAFDLLLGTFFFFFFLQHLALFMSGAGEGESIGGWCVRGIFKSRWMPEVSRETRSEAEEIINWIEAMFVKWIRGYLCIILIETTLYLIGFSFCGVPYAPFLAMAAGLTILLPFLGPIASFLLTALTCVVFCRDHVIGTVIGAAVTYLIINGLLEQFLLYPKLIGNAIELTTVETIIAVLIGGLVAGIPGMIFAVPAAAILKFLIPKIYRAVRKND